jgi:acetylglutamate kinase
LTGADGRIGLATRSGPFTTVAGDTVDLGLVGTPDGDDMSLLTDLLTGGCIPVVASIGVTREGGLLNINADTLAAHLAAALVADRLIVAGATAGVLDPAGQVIPTLTLAGMDRMIASGEAHSGMVAKLSACRTALNGGVREIAIVSGRLTADYTQASGTRIFRELVPS